MQAHGGRSFAAMRTPSREPARRSYELSRAVPACRSAAEPIEASLNDIQSILSHKGSTVFSVAATASIEHAVKTLASHNIGALVVTDSDGRTVGIVSERDVLRALSTRGAVALAQPVSEIMTCEVKICTRQDKLVDVMERMTEGRLRHLPVIENGELVGIVSMRDLVRLRLEEKEQEVAVLQERIVKVEDLLRRIQVSRI
jgi:CBS domain-containing protein